MEIGKSRGLRLGGFALCPGKPHLIRQRPVVDMMSVDMSSKRQSNNVRHLASSCETPASFVLGALEGRHRHFEEPVLPQEP
jgi:hypothetical protein